MDLRLFELPTELRLCIYRALVEDSDIQLNINSSEHSPYFEGNRPIYIWTCSRIVHLSINILYTNKKIYEEAIPALYRSYNFVFQSAWSLQAFLIQIGPSVRYIRSIDVLNTNGYEPTRRVLCRVMTILGQATSLTELKIDATTREMIPPLPASQLKCILHPLLKRIYSINVQLRTRSPSQTAANTSFVKRSNTTPVLYYSIQL